jgi:hypothetical protein
MKLKELINESNGIMVKDLLDMDKQIKITQKSAKNLEANIIKLDRMVSKLLPNTGLPSQQQKMWIGFTALSLFKNSLDNIKTKLEKASGYWKNWIDKAK